MLTWTKDRPREPGVYWLEIDQGEPEALRVFQRFDEWVYAHFNQKGLYSVEAVPDDARWAGPLRPPV
ncbi:hypothetical protein AWB80_06193 [Caballeronia pedi]|uniref:Uncharacterized protein n=1 Tax=Caballeronia pedi TaxID=1777141 RepID=A0A158D2J5_9BURK|nr:hypothetical protein AWB80_06193 [Caballeronia pedi]